MTQKENPLSAADRILARREADKQAKTLAEFERLQKECEVECAAFREIDARLGITASLEQINTRLLEGKGSVSSFLPKAYKKEFTSDQAFSAFWKSEKGRQIVLTGEYMGGLGFKGKVPKELAADRIRKVGVYGDTSVELEWKIEGREWNRNRVKVYYSHSPEFLESPVVLVFGGGWIDESYEGKTDETGREVRPFISEPIDIGSPEFQEKFQSSLAEAFKHSKCFVPPGEMQEVVAG